MKFALIGEKLSHSFSKIIHEAMGKYEYDLVPLKKDELEAFIENPEYKGFNVTIPYKRDIMFLCDCLAPSAVKIGSVNTVIKRDGRLYGYNTDYDGFLAMAKKADINFSGRKVAILGSGGTSLTAKAVASDLGAREIITVSRNGEYSYDNISLWNDAEIIINTTPVGMYPNNGDSLISLKDFPSCQGVLDVVYNPLKTKLIFEAEELNIPASGGLYMLVYQAKKAFEIFTGEELPKEKADEIYENLLKSIQNVVLIGMPGCGKSTLGKEIASSLSREFIDIDKEIEKEADMTIPEIFEKHGEDYFREIEKKITLALCSNTGKVISTGGGVVTREENLYSLKQNGIVYHVLRDVSLLSKEGRPLSQGRDLSEMEKTRKPLYEKFSDRTIDNNKNLTDFKFEY